MFLVLGLEILTQGKPPSIRTRREDHKVPWFLKVGLNVRVRWGGGNDELGDIFERCNLTKVER